MNETFWRLFLPAALALGGLAWIASIVTKRLRWRWIARQLRKELRDMDLSEMATRRRLH